MGSAISKYRRKHRAKSLAGPVHAVGTLSLWEQALQGIRSIDQENLDVEGEECNIKLIHRIIDEIGQKKRECDERRWFYINKKGEKVFFIETLLRQLNRYAMVGDIAIQHNPQVVALAWAGFRALLQVGTSYTNNMRVVAESLECLVTTLCCCDIYEKLYCKRDLTIRNALNASIVNLYRSILEYLCYAKNYLGKTTGARVLEGLSSDLQRLLDDIRENEKAVERNADIAEKEASAAGRSDQEAEGKEIKELLTQIKGSIGKIGGTVEKIYDIVEGEQRSKILGWLSNVQFGSHHSFSSKCRQSNTGHWLLKNEKFLEWRNSMSSSIFWLRGDAGSGKTILASFIIDEFQDQAKSNEYLLAYFYCDYKQPERRDPASILRTIVKQLCLKNPGNPDFLPTLVMSIYKEREQDGHSSGLLSPIESRDLIINLSGKYLQTTIVVDALDECDRTTRRELFSTLYDIVTSTSSRVKIFLTSRYDSDIKEVFASFPSHYINPSDNSGDINNYINAEVERRSSTVERSGAKKLLLNGKVDLELKNRIISTLQNKANGMFMWVHFQILALCEEHTPGGILKALDQLPKDLETTYLQILERIDSQSRASKHTAKVVLRWLLYAQEPCSTASVIQALTVKPEENTIDEDGLNWTTASILSICQNLVVHDEKLQNFRFAHFSVQEFLLGHPDFDEQKGHIYMAKVCLTALKLHPRKANNIPDLIDYSTHNWGAHVFLSGAGTSTLQKLCLAFLLHSPSYTAWGLRVMGKDDNLRGMGYMVVPPLWTACYYQLCGITKFLLDNCHDPNIRNMYGLTPLHHAASGGHEKLVELLLVKGGADLNPKDKDDKAPLHLAASRGHEGVVQLLLEEDGVDVNSKDKDDQTPLHCAAGQGHENVVQLLLEKDGVDVNSGGKDNQTPLHYATTQGHMKVVQFLLDKDGVDVNSKDTSRRTPLSYAATGGYEGIAQLLLGKDGVDVNLKDKDGRTPLHYAASRGYEKVVGSLLGSDGVDVNSKERGGWTPLHYAATRGHEKVVRLLLGKDGVDANPRNKNKMTPLSWAVRNGHKDISRILEGSIQETNSKDQPHPTPFNYAID